MTMKMTHTQLRSPTSVTEHGPMDLSGSGRRESHDTQLKRIWYPVWSCLKKTAGGVFDRSVAQQLQSTHCFRNEMYKQACAVSNS